jgi:hypothetical protein
MRYFLRSLGFLLLSTIAYSVAYPQQLQALHGSSYAGYLANSYNPAAILNSSKKWDVSLFGIQYASVTNGGFVQGANIPGLLRQSTRDSTEWITNNGHFRRYFHLNGSFDVLGIRYRIGSDAAISFGVRMQGYTHFTTNSIEYNDRMNRINGFFNGNQTTPEFESRFQSANALVYSFGFSKMLYQTEQGRLQGGVRLHYQQGIAGMYGRVQDVRATQVAVPNLGARYQLLNARGEYGYSGNLDEVLNTPKGTTANVNSVFQGLQGTFGADIGLEYVFYNANSAYFDRKWEDYSAKISIAILDIGRTKYPYGKYSTAFTQLQPVVLDTSLQRLFDNATGLGTFTDTLRRFILQNPDTLQGVFAINNPTRVVLNTDVALGGNFYVNADLQMNLYSTREMSVNNTRNINLLTLTPRYEVQQLGVYLPIRYTAEGNTWVGFGAKLGPVIFGLHNLGWLFGNNKLPNGGGYFTLQIRSKDKEEGQEVPCPKF